MDSTLLLSTHCVNILNVHVKEFHEMFLHAIDSLSVCNNNTQAKVTDLTHNCNPLWPRGPYQVAHYHLTPSYTSVCYDFDKDIQNIVLTMSVDIRAVSSLRTAHTCLQVGKL